MVNHPDVHAPAQSWSEDQILHVAAAYNNPFRWDARRELANNFKRHMSHSPNVKLHMIELAYGDRPFEVTGPGDRQLRAGAELFHKENLLNLAVAGFPPGWQYGAIIDADFHFARHDWALETVHQLQHYDWVQLFSSYTNVSDKHVPIGPATMGFAWTYQHNGYKLPVGYSQWGGEAPYSTTRRLGPVGATGGAWAFRRQAFDICGGLLDRCILGSGDWFMAFGLAGSGEDAYLKDGRTAASLGYTREYFDYIRAWQARASALKRNIGYIDCHAIHGFHGPKNLRGYSTRDQILKVNEYNPVTDVAPDWQGVLGLTNGGKDKPALRDGVRQYFLSRSEDLPHTESDPHIA